MHLVLASWDGYVLTSDFQPVVVIVITDKGRDGTENVSP